MCYCFCCGKTIKDGEQSVQGLGAYKDWEWHSKCQRLMDLELQFLSRPTPPYPKKTVEAD